MPKPPARTAPAARLSDAELAPRDESIRMWPGHFVDVGDCRIHVRTTPAGAADAEPALFVHGLGGASHNWTDFAGVLRNRLAIDAIDLPGHGRSGPPPNKNYSPRVHADVIIGYLAEHAETPVHLVANSMGGAISILVAAQRPDLVRTLTLISPAVPDNRLRIYPLRSDRRMAALILPVLGEWAVKRFNARYAPEIRAAGTIKLCFAEPSRYPEERMREAVDEMRERLSMPWADSAVLRSMRALARSQFLGSRSGWATMRRIAAPTLVLWGDTDRLVAPDLAPYVAAAIPDSRLLVLERIGHTAMMEDPIGSARALLGLVEDAAAVRS
jgi:pimeloyl-ACP methyl ester carboxylesterase